MLTACYLIVSSLFASSLLIASPALSEVRLPSVWGDGMVIQRNEPVTMRGSAEPGEQVTVTFAGSRVSAVTGADGSWLLTLPPKEAGGPYVMYVTGKNALVLDNILVGDVWLCGGQSNMQWPLRFCDSAGETLAEAGNPMLRIFVVDKKGAGSPRKDCGGRWDTCSPRSIADFSGTAYHFGETLTDELAIPIGLIQSAWGGTPAEAWVSLPALSNEPALNGIRNGWERILEERPPEIERYYDLTAAWFVFAFECMGQKEPYGKLPDPPEGYDKALWAPSWLYNAMIAPLTGFPIRGVIWYQGESNAGRAHQYRALFPALIKDWQRAWGRDDLPFLFCQLATTGAIAETPGKSAWAELREAQTMAADIPGNEMVVTIDLGGEDVHFRNKREVGRRLALTALGTEYNRDVVYKNPSFQGMAVEGSSVRLRFADAGSGLTTTDGTSPRGFSIAGADSVFVWAEARFDGADIIVRNSAVPAPMAVRYGWANNPGCTVISRDGLPLAPFRSDDFPATAGR